MNVSEAREVLLDLGALVDPKPGRVRLETNDVFAVLTIDNAVARNAITVQMMVDLAEAVMALSEWEGAAIVLRSADPTIFCAGGHLGQVSRAIRSRQDAVSMARAMTTVLDGLLNLPQISVAAIGGLAVGGGAEIATACDFRVAQPDSAIHFIHTRLGIATGWGGAERLVTHIGRRQALWMLLDAEPVDAETAREIGLVDAVTDNADVGARALLEVVLSRAPEAVRATKRQVVGSDPVGAFADIWGGQAHKAALEAMGKHLS
jgi:ethylmalonyl-CoA/methylmalonyl-CoA decarboxylase